MSNRQVHSRLYSIIYNSLRPIEELLPASFNKENMKDLLIALSQVCSQIKLWTLEFASDSDSDAEVAGDCAGVIDCSVSGSDTESGPCLSKAISVLVELLALENPYVQHLVGNILVAISDLIVALGSSQDEFMQLLSLLQLAIVSSIPSSSGSKLVDAKSSCCNPAASVSPIKSVNWLRVAVIIQVLRRILKNLKLDADDHFMKLYLGGLTNSFISNMPWDLLDGVFVSQTSKASGDLNVNGLLQFQAANPKPVIMFLGSFIQLLCSLVDISLPIEDVTGDLHKHTTIYEINNILPRLLGWCLGNFQNFGSVYISKYYKHKFLILMIRLSSGIQLDYSVLLSWLYLIHVYFQDLLCLPIAGVESDQHKCLEGSPFSECVFDAAKENISSSHLQRLAIFLFLRCSFCLVNTERSGQNCVSTDLNSRSAVNLTLDIECHSQSKGLQEIHEWLQLISNDVFLDHKKCAESIFSFQLSFLQLYMHEDDILFQMLLQLFCIPFFSEKWFVKEGTPSADINMSSIISDLFNPVYLFHHFLAEIHYDHQVLLDYLISKDTGASSAEYILRCLRMVFKSWSLFQNFPWSVRKETQLCQKRRKFSTDHLNFQEDLSTSVTESICLPVEQDQKRRKPYEVINCRTERLPFECASNCLLELKTSIESLDHKNLFPYNPQALLQRLSRFQELCQKH